MKGLNKNYIIIGALVVVVAVGAYIYLNRSGSQSDQLLSSATSTTDGLDTNLLAALRSLQVIRLDSSIFSSPVWASLNDFSQPLPPEPAGRPDPFAPIGSSTPSR
ncbi:MAG: hypothetical protein KGI79_00600 [Patescibacteria group bacterium]|nr:hypothetical protein [Patescibacteria group bacterium]MDE2116361.1 hypothetical protein [Patescibacteria group bacterium]